MSSKEKPPVSRESYQASLKAFRETFFCERRRCEVTQGECSDLFCFSNALDCQHPEKFAATDPLCVKCPIGQARRQAIAVQLPEISCAQAQKMRSQMRRKPLKTTGTS